MQHGDEEAKFLAKQRLCPLHSGHLRKEARYMSKEVRAALYARVSTSNGAQDPSMQLREMREYCDRRRWKIVDEYVDVGISGAKDTRPELDRMMRDAHKLKFTSIVVWKFDRFARGVSHLLRASETFNALGVEFVSLTEGVDTSTPAGKMVFTVLGAVAELERDLVSERVRAGMRNAKAKGRHIGRPPLRTFSAVEAEQIRTARRMENTSTRKLAIQFNTTQWMVSRILSGHEASS